MFDVIFGVAYFSIFGLVAFAEFLFADRRVASPDRRFLTNFGLGFVNFALFAAVPLSLVVTASFAQTHRLGLFNHVEHPRWVALVASLACLSLFQYVAHRAFHTMPLLWRIHRVHHSDRLMDASSTLRTHPLEHLILLAMASVLVIALGTPVWAIYIIAAVTFAGATFSHGNLRIAPTWARRLSRLVATPQFHILHHSTERSQCDSNYGDTFTVWDQLFGSYRQGAVARIGLGDAADVHADSLIGQLRDPFARAINRTPAAGDRSAAA